MDFLLSLSFMGESHKDNADFEKSSPGDGEKALQIYGIAGELFDSSSCI